MIESIRSWANINMPLFKIIGIVYAIFTPIVGLIYAKLPIIQKYLPDFIGVYFKHYVDISILLLFAITLYLLKLLSNFKILLPKKEALNLENWRNTGGWSTRNKEITVCGAHIGGVLRIGSNWENYSFEFDFKILHRYAGWIIRANSIGNHVMLQIGATEFRPHSLQGFRESEENNRQQLGNYSLIANITHRLNIDNNWHKARTSVWGNKLIVYIDGKIIWEESNVLENYPTGTIGFRCFDQERAVFKNIVVNKI